MWGHMYNYDYGWGWGMGIGMLLFWGLLIAAIVALLRVSSRHDAAPRHDREKTALDLLKERYARGDIEREEFLQKKRDLES